MSKIVTVVGLALLLFSSAGCVQQEQYRRALQDNDNLRKQLELMADRNEGLQRRLDELRAQIEAMPPVPTEDWQQRVKALRDEIERLLANGAMPTGVTLRAGPEGIVYDVEGAVLFASGRAEITPTGRDTLQQIIGSLQSSGRRIRVEGHTDTDPIRNSPWKTNLRLSAERALVVAEFLIGAGLPAERIGVAAYGPHRPIDPANTEAAKARNRRVEILLIDEPRGADAPR